MRNGDVISQHVGAARWDTDEMVALLTGSPAAASARIRSKWEQRLPAVEPPWTHWRLIGEGAKETLLADIPVEDLAGAVRAVTANYRSFPRVSATLVRFADDGSCVLSKQRNVVSSPSDRTP